MTTTSLNLRNVPTQARSRARLRQVLDAADALLARDGAGAFTTTRVAEVARVPIGSVYRFFPDKESIIEALAVNYWSEFEDAVADIADADGVAPFEDLGGAVIDVLVSAFRARPGFLSLWYGGLRTERIRDATRPTRAAIAGTLERMLANHWPAASQASRARAAEMVVIAGDGLLREAFRRDRKGDAKLLAEGKTMVSCYLTARLGG